MVGGGLEPSTAVMGWEMWYTLDRSKVLSQGKHKNRQNFTTVVNVESWHDMSFDCAENPRIYMENMQAYAHRKA